MNLFDSDYSVGTHIKDVIQFLQRHGHAFGHIVSRFNHAVMRFIGLIFSRPNILYLMDFPLMHSLIGLIVDALLLGSAQTGPGTPIQFVVAAARTDPYLRLDQARLFLRAKAFQVQSQLVVRCKILFLIQTHLVQHKALQRS
jgi:hypothetical protein